MKGGTWNIVVEGDVTQVAITVNFLYNAFDIISVISEMVAMVAACDRSKKREEFVRKPKSRFCALLYLRLKTEMVQRLRGLKVKALTSSEKPVLQHFRLLGEKKGLPRTPSFAYHAHIGVDVALILLLGGFVSLKWARTHCENHEPHSSE